jgi:flagellar hook-basal body complex protein FliE
MATIASNPLAALAQANQLAGQSGAAAPNAGTGFAEMLGGLISQAQTAQTNASQATAAVASGQDVPLHEVVQAISQAELTLQTLVTVRDRAVEAYQEIARMPI